MIPFEDQKSEEHHFGITPVLNLESPPAVATRDVSPMQIPSLLYI